MPYLERVAAILAIIIVFAGVALYVVNRASPTNESAFFAEGNLVEGNPGLAAGVWHLVYEEPGFPGLTVPLRFDERSFCTASGKTQECGGFLQGDRVQVSGQRRGEEIYVESLVFVNPDERNIPVRVYFYDSRKQGARCDASELVAVERVIPHTTTPLADTIKLLLQGEISDAEKAVGVISEFPLLGVRLESASITDGVATLSFSDEQGKTSGGSCRVSIMRAQIEETAKQFETVQSVRIVPETVFQP